MEEDEKHRLAESSITGREAEKVGEIHVAKPSGRVQWVIAFAASIVINVPRQLNRHHHASDRVWRQVVAAIVLIVLVTLLFRLLFFSLSWYGERKKRKEAETPPLTPYNP